MLALEVRRLRKKYPNFELKDVSFQLEMGYIMGFIGANGAGKTTTIKSILNLLNIDEGEIHVLGQTFEQDEMSLKQQVGYTLGGTNYYTRSKIKDLTRVTKSFYKDWNEGVYRQYLNKFEIDENKKVSELSEGMRVKYSLSVALSHGAKLLILDEPTSGLDPAARDNLLELFQELVEPGDLSILFSTHITSDLEKCADFITFIHRGEIVNSAEKDAFIDHFALVHGSIEQLNGLKAQLIGYKQSTFGFSGLIYRSDLDTTLTLETTRPSLEDVMVYFSKKEANHA